MTPDSQIIRVFPRRTNYTPTDDMVFMGFPQLFRPFAEEVHVSCTFTWDIPLAKSLHKAWSDYYAVVKLGGVAFDDLGGEFTPGLYVKQGITITSRGCPFNCEWCYVPKREGKIRTLKINPGNIVQDNNLLACPDEHIGAVFDMLKTQKQVKFSGGLDTRLLKEWHVKEFEEMSIKELWFAADYPKNWGCLERTAGLLKNINKNKKRCYVLIGYKDDTIQKAEKRLIRICELGFLPFAQFYRGHEENKKTNEWKAFQRIWSKPAIIKAVYNYGR